jgi:hypothetical protein
MVIFMVIAFSSISESQLLRRFDIYGNLYGNRIFNISEQHFGEPIFQGV